MLAELLAGVDHRIGRFFGPARIRGRKRRAKALRVLPACHRRARRGGPRRSARSSPSSCTGRSRTQSTRPGRAATGSRSRRSIDGEPNETWYLTADDGAGLSVSPTARGRTPDASVSMTRDVFDRLVRAEPVASGERPIIRGDREAVAHMTAWTRRAQA